MAYLNVAAGQAREGTRATTIAAVTGAIPAGGTGATEGAYDTAANRNTTITTATEIKTQLNALIAALKTAGLVASS